MAVAESANLTPYRALQPSWRRLTDACGRIDFFSMCQLLTIVGVTRRTAELYNFVNADNASKLARLCALRNTGTRSIRTVVSSRRKPTILSGEAQQAHAMQEVICREFGATAFSECINVPRRELIDSIAFFNARDRWNTRVYRDLRRWLPYTSI